MKGITISIDHQWEFKEAARLAGLPVEEKINCSVPGKIVFQVKEINEQQSLFVLGIYFAQLVTNVTTEFDV